MTGSDGSLCQLPPVYFDHICLISKVLDLYAYFALY